MAQAKSTGRAMMKARILTVGLDEPLVETRAAILRSRYEAVTTTPGEALEKLRGEHYDLVLVCHSTPHEQGTALIHQAREEFPALPIVRLLLNDSPHIAKPVANILVMVDYRPQTWMKAVDELLPSYQSP
jgi:CheY-like chemotaxis protein